MPDNDIIKFRLGIYKRTSIWGRLFFIIALASMNAYISMLIALNKSSLGLLFVTIGGMLFAFILGKLVIKFRIYTNDSEKTQNKSKDNIEVETDANDNISYIRSTTTLREVFRPLIIIIAMLLLCIIISIIGMVLLSKEWSYMITLFTTLSFVEWALYHCILIISKLILQVMEEHG